MWSNLTFSARRPKTTRKMCVLPVGFPILDHIVAFSLNKMPLGAYVVAFSPYNLVAALRLIDMRSPESSVRFNMPATRWVLSRVK